jgi:hypothetical protein
LEHIKNNTGIFSLTKEKLSENGKKGASKTKELGVGVYGMNTEQRSKYGRIGGLKEGKRNGERNKKQKLGYCGMTFEERSAAGKKGASQKWMCLETGFISNAGPLTQYQRKRGIDVSLRVMV